MENPLKLKAHSTAMPNVRRPKRKLLQAKPSKGKHPSPPTIDEHPPGTQGQDAPAETSEPPPKSPTTTKTTTETDIQPSHQPSEQEDSAFNIPSPSPPPSSPSEDISHQSATEYTTVLTGPDHDGVAGTAELTGPKPTKKGRPNKKKTSMSSINPSDAESSQPKEGRSSWYIFSDSQEVELAEFYRENELFYNKKLKSYKDSGKKRRLLEEKAASIDPPCTCKNLTLFIYLHVVCFSLVYLKSTGDISQ